jgi:multiple sugar transport system ATP-binding protein
MADVRMQQVKKDFGGVEIIKGVDLAVADGEFCVFVGPSGCGKSTLLRMIAGLEDISAGALEIGGRDMTRVPPANRGVAMVFQSYALYPHMTVAENIGFGLRMAGAPKAEIAAKVGRAAEMLHLAPLLARKPAQLSGGQRQRVAIGRAIVREPGVFLFDEPLSNLDAALRVQMRVEIGKLHNDLRSTMIYVTHDQVEAMTMAEKIVVLNAGRIEQIGSPLELYHRPVNRFVAGFIGSPKMNFLECAMLEGGGGMARVALPGGGALAVPLRDGRAPTGKAVTLGIRPEHLALGAAGDGQVIGRIRLAEHLGSESLFYIDLPGGAEIAVRADGLAKGRAGDTVEIGIPARAAHLFDGQGNAIANGSLID